MTKQEQFISERQHCPSINEHTVERYEKRFKSGDVPLQTAWERGIRVEAPQKSYEEARIYPPEKMLMLRRNGHIKTVFGYRDTFIDASGTVRCDSCGDPHYILETSETCPWCGATATGGRSSGTITLIDKRSN